MAVLNKKRTWAIKDGNKVIEYFRTKQCAIESLPKLNNIYIKKLEIVKCEVNE